MVRCGRKLYSAATASALLTLAGCDHGPSVADALACFPADARPWVYREAPDAAKGDAAAKPAAHATLYVDRSGSMGGYIAGASADERPLQDLIGVLPTMLDRGGTALRYAAFGTKIAPQPAAARDALMRSDFYTCKGAAPGSCDNQESRFDLVFDEIRRKPGEMALLVSDLWFMNSNVQTSALSDLAGPMSTILADGRAIAVYGIPARFKGPIYDVPGGSGAIPFDGRHPLFLVAVGSDAQLDQLDESMRRSPSPYLAKGIADGTIKRTVFTLHPRASAAADPEPLKGNDPAVARTPVIASLPGVRIEQLQIAKSDALRAHPAKSGIGWTGPSDALFRPDTVWNGPLEGRARVWERRATACGPADWIEGRPLAGAWQTTGAGQLRFTLDPRAVATGVGRSGTYLVTGEVHRTALATPNAASAWMRTWSFAPGETTGGRVVGGSRFFPTLHLSEVARLMENSLAEAARRQPKPIAGFDVIIKVSE